MLCLLKFHTVLLAIGATPFPESFGAAQPLQRDAHSALGTGHWALGTAHCPQRTGQRQPSDTTVADV